MSKAFRRFEILLPLRFNDGRAVPEELIADTMLELRDRFGAVSQETQAIRGLWTHQGDDTVRAFVDAEDVASSRQFFIEFKERLKQRFGQLDIWMTTHPVEVL